MKVLSAIRQPTCILDQRAFIRVFHLGKWKVNESVVEQKKQVKRSAFRLNLKHVQISMVHQ